MPLEYAPFSKSEYDRRITKTRTAMTAAGIDVLFATDPSNQAWLTGYDGWSFYVHQGAILGLEGDPIWWGRMQDTNGGRRTVWMEDDQMMIHLLPTDIFVGHLSHWQYNTWKVDLKKVPALPSGLVNFVIDDQGKVVELQMDVPNPDFDFTELKFYKKK